MIFDKNLTYEDIIARRDVVIREQKAEIKQLQARVAELEQIDRSLVTANKQHLGDE